jgi:N,N'-diacetyllegionaminate synthase
VLARVLLLHAQNKKGELLTEDNITVKRPGTVISPKAWNEVVGNAATNNITE